MTYLTPSSDRIVRSAVADYLSGRRRPRIPSEAILETRNSRYRFIDGRVVESADEALKGAELVGWLEEDDEGTVQTSRAWRPGLRAILVDHQNHRHIVVTSQTRAFGDGIRPKTGSPPAQSPGSPLPRFESSPSIPNARVAPPAEPTPKTVITRQPSAIPALPPAPQLTPPGRPIAVHALAVAGPPPSSKRRPKRGLPPLAIARPLPPPNHPSTRSFSIAEPGAPLPSFAVESSDRMPIRDLDVLEASSPAPNPAGPARGPGPSADDCDDLAETAARPAAGSPVATTTSPSSIPPSTRRRGPPPPPRRRLRPAPQAPISSS